MRNISRYQLYKSPLGLIKIEYNENTILSIGKVEEHLELMLNEIPSLLSETVVSQLKEYFEGNRKEFDFQYELKGTEFQKKVWTEISKIPYGETRSYKDIAIAIGNPKAVRAVGTACNKNPITIAIPCHRVVGSNGKLVGYEYGIDMKRKLLKLERD